MIPRRIKRKKNHTNKREILRKMRTSIESILSRNYTSAKAALWACSLGGLKTGETDPKKKKKKV